VPQGTANGSKRRYKAKVENRQMLAVSAADNGQRAAAKTG
jgi:hypothetical protein